MSTVFYSTDLGLSPRVVSFATTAPPLMTSHLYVQQWHLKRSQGGVTLNRPVKIHSVKLNQHTNCFTPLPWQDMKPLLPPFSPEPSTLRTVHHTTAFHPKYETRLKPRKNNKFTGVGVYITRGSRPRARSVAAWMTCMGAALHLREPPTTLAQIGIVHWLQGMHPGNHPLTEYLSRNVHGRL